MYKSLSLHTTPAIQLGDLSRSLFSPADSIIISFCIYSERLAVRLTCRTAVVPSRATVRRRHVRDRRALSSLARLVHRLEDQFEVLVIATPLCRQDPSNASKRRIDQSHNLSSHASPFAAPNGSYSACEGNVISVGKVEEALVRKSSIYFV